MLGDHPFVFRDAPSKYVWQTSPDGRTYTDLPETQTDQERRLFRLHRLATRPAVQFLRLDIASAEGAAPVLREVEFFSDPDESVPFPDWTIVVNTTHDPKLPNEGQEFIPLARSISGWADLKAQQVWLRAFDLSFIRAEPRPLCAFLSGNFKDWCEVDRELWRGTQGVLQDGSLPLWASCGGAQGLAILAENGVDTPWDCPHCRDPKQPKTPIYTHIGHQGRAPCGDYSQCLFERGPHAVRQVADDPVFAGLPREFQIMESHCGQIEWSPPGWVRIAGPGQGTQTKTQCLRRADRYIYAAQFHIEMPGAPENSRRIMGNFLALAKQWNGDRARTTSVPAPAPLPGPALLPVPNKLVVLTFDDSVASQYSIVRPLLKQHHFSATFFITEGFGFRTNQQDYMTWEQIAELHRDGFEIGNHTRDHMSVSVENLGRIKEQVEAINARCLAHGIPRPISFGYPGNAIAPEALGLLRSLGFHFARRGGSPEFPYERGRGFAYEPGVDHPLLIPSAGDARPDWTLDDFKRAVSQARDGRIAVLQFHGVPDRDHPWVHTPPALFKRYVQYLHEGGFTVVALRDLAKYVDPETAPSDPYAVIEKRKAATHQPPAGE